MKKSELREIIREELLNEAKLTVGGIKFITSISLNNNLEINFIPSKMVEDKSKGSKARKRVVVVWSKFGTAPTKTFRHFAATCLWDAQNSNVPLTDK